MMKLSNKGFTLTELLLAAAILVFALAGLLLLFINCILLNESSRNLTLAYNAIQTKMEEIKNTGFDCLDTSSCPTCDCPTSTSCPSGCTNCFRDDCIFDLAGFPSGSAKGRIDIEEESSNLKRIRIVACFMSRNRLIGDSINSCTTSPVELITLISE